MKGPAGLSGRIRGLVAVLIVAGCASVLPEADQGVLDFSPPPVNLHPGRHMITQGLNHTPNRLSTSTGLFN